MKIAFYKGKHRIFDRLVQWWTRSPYSHCELVFGTLDTGQSECGSSSFRDGGVRIKLIELVPEKWDIVEVPDNLTDAAYDWFLLHLGEKYDVPGLFGFIIPLRNRSSKWFCSEAVTAALGYKDPWRFSPGILDAAVSIIRSSAPDHS